MRVLPLAPLLLTLVGCASEVRDENTGGTGPTGGSGTGGAGPSSTASASTSTSGGASGTGSTATATSSSSTGGAGGGPSFTACDAPGSCTLAPKDCCAPCADPSLDDYDAIHVDAVEPHADAVCPDDVACPPCAPAHDPDLFAFCDVDQGRCVGARLPATELAACSDASECTLRAGALCCEACGEAWDDPWGWVALRADAEDDLRALLCAPDGGCPECGPAEPPDGLVADCIDGACTVVLLERAPR